LVERYFEPALVPVRAAAILHLLQVQTHDGSGVGSRRKVSVGAHNYACEQRKLRGCRVAKSLHLLQINAHQPAAGRLDTEIPEVAMLDKTPQPLLISIQLQLARDRHGVEVDAHDARRGIVDAKPRCTSCFVKHSAKEAARARFNHFISVPVKAIGWYQ